MVGKVWQGGHGSRELECSCEACGEVVDRPGCDEIKDIVWGLTSLRTPAFQG